MHGLFQENPVKLDDFWVPLGHEETSMLDLPDPLGSQLQKNWIQLKSQASEVAKSRQFFS